MPRITWAAFRAPGIALAGNQGIQAPAVVIPSTTAAVLAATDTATEDPAGGAAPAAPLARTGGDASASTALALTLIVMGGVLRRTSRLHRATSS